MFAANRKKLSCRQQNTEENHHLQQHLLVKKNKVVRWLARLPLIWDIGTGFNNITELLHCMCTAPLKVFVEPHSSGYPTTRRTHTTR